MLRGRTLFFPIFDKHHFTLFLFFAKHHDVFLMFFIKKDSSSCADLPKIKHLDACECVKKNPIALTIVGKKLYIFKISITKHHIP